MRVLVIEDDSMQRLLIRRLLEKNFEAKVDEAPDGSRGLEKLRQSLPDLVLLDTQMPVMDGLTMLQELRALPGGEDVRVIAISSVSDRQVIQKMISLGILDYLLKPLDMVRAAARIERVLTSAQTGAI